MLIELTRGKHTVIDAIDVDLAGRVLAGKFGIGWIAAGQGVSLAMWGCLSLIHPVSFRYSLSRYPSASSDILSAMGSCNR